MSANYRNEYAAPTVASSGCAYNSLCNYYGANGTMAPLPQGTTSGSWVTPGWGAIGYDALTHGKSPSCNTYFNIQDAYGSGAGNCQTQYTTRLCGGNCGPKPVKNSMNSGGGCNARSY
jgi:hypothetical protein